MVLNLFDVRTWCQSLQNRAEKRLMFNWQHQNNNSDDITATCIHITVTNIVVKVRFVHMEFILQQLFRGTHYTMDRMTHSSKILLRAAKQSFAKLMTRSSCDGGGPAFYENSRMLLFSTLTSDRHL